MSKDQLFETQEQPVAMATDDGLFGHRFAVQRLLASGRAGLLFRAWDKVGGGSVALKVLPPLEREAAERFLGEADVLPKLNHPAINRHVAHGLTPQNQPYLASEWLDGENLSQCLVRGRLAPDIVARLGARVLHALAAAHRQGLVHRNLKPSNLLLPDQDPARVVVLDLGVGLCGPTAWSLPHTGVTSGPNHRPPERVRDPGILDGRTDVFSLGCILYECATGQCLSPDHAGASDFPHDGLAGRCTGVPQPLRMILERMIARGREDRPLEPDRLSSDLLEVARVLEGIETRFAISVSPRGDFRVLFEKGPREAPQTLSGRNVPCFGRERELDLLEGLWHEVCAQSVARAIVISAPAGGGKTRLRQELCERVKRSGPAFQLLVGGGDPMHDGSPLSVLAPALLSATGLTGSEPVETKRQRLVAEVEHAAKPDQGQRVAAFLGEMAHIPFPDDHSCLGAARLNPRLMADHIRMAWIDWLEAACNRHPVMLVLEDLHWGDSASVALTEAALRILHNKPLLVMALAQPEVDHRFMNLWREPHPQRIHLAPLSARQSQRLIEYVAGSLPGEQVREMVELAQGNPFFIEELLRVVLARGQVRQQPSPTALGLVQTRLRALTPESQLALGACAVLGRGIRADAVKAVVESEDHLDVERGLAHLEEQEILFSYASIAGREFSFHHALIRQEAYAMLPHDQRCLGHLWAGRFLEQQGEPDARVLAEHFERGRDKSRAVHWLKKAAMQALHADDMTGTLALMNRALTLGASKEDEEELRAVEAEIRLWHEDHGEVVRAARVAVSSQDARTRWRATSSLWAALAAQTKTEDMARRLPSLIEPPKEPDLYGYWLNCLSNAIPFLVTDDGAQARERFVEQVTARLDSTSADAPWLGKAEALLAHLAHASGQPIQAQAGLARAALCHARLQDRRAECEARADLGQLLLRTGRIEEAERCLNPLLTTTQRLELPLLLGRIAEELARSLAYRGAWDEARDLGLRALAVAEARHDRRRGGWAEAGLALTELLAGNYASAEKFAIAGIAGLKLEPQGHSMAQSLLARALLAQARIGEALQHAREAHARLKSPRIIDGIEGTVHLALAECLLASGDTRAAHEVLRRASKRLGDLADTITESTARTSFLTRLPEHARILLLCRQASLQTPAVP